MTDELRRGIAGSEEGARQRAKQFLAENNLSANSGFVDKVAIYFSAALRQVNGNFSQALSQALALTLVERLPNEAEQRRMQRVNEFISRHFPKDFEANGELVLPSNFNESYDSERNLY